MKRLEFKKKLVKLATAFSSTNNYNLIITFSSTNNYNYTLTTIQIISIFR